MSFSENEGDAGRPDPINPSHYKAGGLECIDAIRAALTPEEFAGFCKGNVIKYSWRANKKAGTEDMEKAAWYAAFAAGKDPRRCEGE